MSHAAAVVYLYARASLRLHHFAFTAEGELYHPCGYYHEIAKLLSDAAAPSGSALELIQIW